jgi:hypothetical protein
MGGKKGPMELGRVSRVVLFEQSSKGQSRKEAAQGLRRKVFNKQYYHTSSTLTLSKQLRDRKVEAEVEVKGKERAGGGLRSLALVLDQSNRQNLLLNHTNHLLLLLPLLLLRLKLDKRVGSLRGGKCCKYGFGWVISCHILS